MAEHLIRSNSAKPRKKTPAQAAPEAHAKADGYIPFRDRFRAWWDGVEPEAVVRKGQKARTSRKRRVIELDDKADLAPEVDWGAARIRLCDQVWGDGFVGPGGASYAVEMARPFSSRAESSVLDLSAGLGGRIEEIAGNPEVTVAGMERDAAFADTAAERIKRLARRNVRPIQSFNPERLNLKGLKFDCILARELFFTVPDKLALLGKLRNGLRKGGGLAFTDFVLAEPDQNEGAVMRRWHETEPVPPRPWSLKEYETRLPELNLSVFEFEDDSKPYREMVVRAWQAYADGLDSVAFDRTLVDALMQEAELWLHRIRAIESGQLRVLRVFGRMRVGRF